MKVWRQLLAVLLALAWVPLVAHCEIAGVLGLDLLHQGCDHDEAPPASSDCDHCILCQTVDTGATLGSKLTLIRPALSAVEPGGPVASAVPEPAPEAAPETSPPPRLVPPPGRICLLTLRTALPARAPSPAA